MSRPIAAAIARGIVDTCAVRNLRFVEEHLGGKHDVLAERGDSIAHQQFVVSGKEHHIAIHLRRVEEGAARLVCLADSLDTVCLFGHLSVAVGKSHAAHTNLGNFQLS